MVKDTQNVNHMTQAWKKNEEDSMLWLNYDEG